MARNRLCFPFKDTSRKSDYPRDDLINFYSPGLENKGTFPLTSPVSRLIATCARRIVASRVEGSPGNNEGTEERSSRGQRDAQRRGISQETEEGRKVGAEENEFGVPVAWKLNIPYLQELPGNRIARDYDYPCREERVIYPVAVLITAPGHIIQPAATPC